MDYQKKIKDLVNFEKERTSKGPNERNKKVREKRFAILLNLCKRLAPSKDVEVLDIGRSEFTNILSSYYNNVTSFGFPLGTTKNEGIESESEKNSHIVFDLNNSPNYESWPKPEKKFDLIIYGETIEHIYTAPEYSLLMLRSLLSDNGKIIITTPNAVALHKRIRLALGRNPYERIRYFDKNPGHFREYTMKEMDEICRKTGFNILERQFHRYSNINYFSSFSAFKYVFILPFEVIPSFKSGMVLVIEKNKAM